MPIKTHSATSSACSLLKENKLLSTGKNMTKASIDKAPEVTHHKAGLGDCRVAQADFDQERLVNIKPTLASTSVVKVSARFIGAHAAI